MTGLRIMNELMDPAKREVVIQHARFYDGRRARRWKPRR